MATIDFDLNEVGMIHLVFDDLSPEIESRFYSLIGQKRYLKQSKVDREIRFMTTLAEMLDHDLIIQISLEFEDGSKELRTFDEIEVNIDLSCLSSLEDINDINLRNVSRGVLAVPFVESLFLAIEYKHFEIEESPGPDLPTGYIDGVPVNSFGYVNAMSDWMSKALN